jgi:glycoside/pentoside/hexuronide:cation symporter, GPH family
MKRADTLTYSDVLSYAMGSFGTGVFSTVPAVLLLYFCTETLKISGGVAAVLILLPKLWSIIWDPFVGIWSDRSTLSWGRRRPFMIAGILGMVSAFVTLFNVPDMQQGQTIAWIGISYFLLATLYSLYAVPYIAIPAEISPTPQILSKLISWRMFLVMIGIIVGAAGAPEIVSASGGGRAGYGVMGWVIGLMCLVIMALPLIMLRGRDRQMAAGNAPASEYGLIENIRSVIRNTKFRTLAITYLAQATAFGSVSAMVPYVVTKGLGRPEADIGIALLLYLLATVLAVPLWSWLGRKYGLQRALIWAALGYGAGVIMIGLLTLSHANWGLALVVLSFAGMPFAGLQVLPFTLVGEVVRSEANDAEGQFTGVWTATEKLGLSMGPALLGIAISIAGEQTALGIGIFACTIPPILCVISALLTRRLELAR